MTQELKIVSAKISNEIQRGNGWHGPCFYVAVAYTDENGGTHNDAITAKRKKDIPAAIERKEKAIANGNMYVQGAFIITRTEIS